MATSRKGPAEKYPFPGEYNMLLRIMAISLCEFTDPLGACTESIIYPRQISYYICFYKLRGGYMIIEPRSWCPIYVLPIRWKRQDLTFRTQVTKEKILYSVQQ